MDATNPYAAPQSTDQPSASLPTLGRLAQSARDKEIKQARTLLIIVGVLTLGANIFALSMLPKEIEQAVQQNQVDPANVEQFKTFLTWFGYVIYGGMGALGVLFIILGLLVKKYPVPITVTSLVLYILAMIGLGLLNPMTLLSGWWLKIIFIVGLFKAVKAAKAYESDTKKAAAAGMLLE